MPGPTNTWPALPCASTTRGARSLRRSSTRSTHRLGGSIMCESADITRAAGIKAPPVGVFDFVYTKSEARPDHNRIRSRPDQVFAGEEERARADQAVFAGG